MSVDDLTEDRECPLCMEKFEIDDLNFYPCTCKYQVCRFCWHRIKTDENGLCPACRTPYPDDPVNFQPLTPSEVQQLRTEKKQKEKKKNVSESRKHLAAYRVLQRNLVYVLGLSSNIADPDILKSQKYFGKYGKVLKVAVGTLPSNQGHPINTAYVTFSKVDDALKTILETNSLVFDGRMIKTSLGTTKYCSNFLRGMTCHKQECMYLHEVAPPELSFTKEDMHQGKHTEYERKLLEKMQMEFEKNDCQNSKTDKDKSFENPENERTISPIMNGQGNDIGNVEETPSAQESGTSEPETSFDIDAVYDYPPASTVEVHRESVKVNRIQEPVKIKQHNSSSYPVIEDDLGFDPLAESLKGLEELLQEEESHPQPSLNNLEYRKGVDYRKHYDPFHSEFNNRREGETSSSNHLTQNNGFNGYHNGFDSRHNGRSNFNVHDNYYNSMPSDFYMYRASHAYSPFMRQEQQSLYNNGGSSLNRLNSNNSSQGISSSHGTYESRDAFKALLPNVNVSFVSSPTEMQNLFSSSPNSFNPSSNQFSHDNYRGMSDLGYSAASRQSNNYEIGIGRPQPGISGLKWMVSPPPGFDNSRSQGQG